jgi:pimeloyl-ACP methyl ester carboxylesterase
MRSIELRIDVTDTIAIGEPAAIAATLHLPDTVAEGATLELLIAIHGGGYTRGYWHPRFDGFPGYSFAEHMTALGYAVAAFDMLGMGESARPEDEAKLSREKAAAAHHQVAAEIEAGLASGRWASAGHIVTTGIGHSMGGLMVITQQGWHRSFDRLAVLGWANLPMVLGDIDPAEMAAAIRPGYLPSPRVAMRGFFYAPDVPLALIKADEAAGTTTPSCLGRDALTPGIVHAEAAAIACPVFIAHGVIDTSPDPRGEAAYFKASQDVTVMVLPDTAHCHNFATLRHRLWDRMDRWIASLPIA